VPTVYDEVKHFNETDVFEQPVPPLKPLKSYKGLKHITKVPDVLIVYITWLYI